MKAVVQFTLCCCMLYSGLEESHAQSLEKEVLGGNLRLYYNDAIYTPVYDYVHPDTSVRVRFLATHRVGLGAYFSDVKRQLAECSSVIYEDTPIATTPISAQQLEQALQQVQVGSHSKTSWSALMERSKVHLFGDYVRTMHAAYALSSTAIECEHEAEALSEERANPRWIAGDKQYFEELENDPTKQQVHGRRLNKLMRKTGALPVKKLADTVWTLKMWGRLGHTAQNDGIIRFTPINFAAVPLNAYQSEKAFALYREMYLEPLSEAMFENVFDPLVAKADKPADFHVGIKYSVEHAEHIRQLLEGRGFELEETAWLVNMSLEPRRP